MSATDGYMRILAGMKAGELGLLRTHAGQGLDESVEGFDLFSGLWWPLRQRSERVPRREVAWIIAKLYAFRPIAHSLEDTLPRQLRRCQPNSDSDQVRFRERFDRMLTLSLDQVEPVLQWALNLIDENNLKLDWVKLTDDLSKWERETTRREWAQQFLETNERK